MFIKRFNSRVYLLPVAGLFVASLIFSGCDSKEGAKKAIEQKGITYNAESFAKAIDSKNTEVIDLFIKAGIDLGSKEALEALAKSNDTATFKKMLDAGLNPNTKVNDNGKNISLIFALIGTGSAELAETLLNAEKIDVNVQETDGMTPIMGAIALSTPKIVGMLIAKGANPSLQNSSGLDAVNMAVGAAASANDDAKGAELLRAMGDKLNAKTVYEKLEGTTALTTSTLSCLPKTTEILINKGADVNVKVKKDLTTPLIAVAMSESCTSDDNRMAIIDMLLKKGADKKAKDSSGMTAYDYIGMKMQQSGGSSSMLTMLEKLHTDGSRPIGAD